MLKDLWCKEVCSKEKTMEHNPNPLNTLMSSEYVLLCSNHLHVSTYMCSNHLHESTHPCCISELHLNLLPIRKK